MSQSYVPTGAAGFAHRLSASLTRVNTLVGRGVAWLTLIMVLVTAYVVVMRYGFGIGSIPAQESITYMHCAVFMLGSAMTLSRGGHVRVDIFYQHWSVRRKAIVDLLGALFLLLPFAFFLVSSSLDYVAASWRINEGSPEAEGLKLVWLLKTLIPALGVMLAMQGIADALRNTLILLGVHEPGDQAELPSEEKI